MDKPIPYPVIRATPGFFRFVMISGWMLCLGALGCNEDVSSPQRAGPGVPSGAQDEADPTPSGEIRQSMATHFDDIGFPAGGCGVPHDALESVYFVALNVQNTANDYTTHLPRPIPAADPTGEYQNGRNCGRWVRVAIGDFCTGVNSGAPGKEFCAGGSWTADEFNGATQDLLVTDSCQDGNRWCRDDRFHLDLATASLTRFTKDGVRLEQLPARWNNRKISWQYIEAPGYAGDIAIGFRNDATRYWPAIVFTQLKNGIHGVEMDTNGTWQKLTMISDNGQVYELKPTADNRYRIRLTDASDRLIHDGRVYEFAFPAECGERCQAVYTQVSYTTN